MTVFREAVEADRDAWQHLLGRSPAGDFLHDWSWAEVAAHDGEPQRRFVVEAGGDLIALCAAQVRRTALGRSYWYVPHGPVLDYGGATAADSVRAIVRGLAAAGRRDRAIAVKLEPRIEAKSPQLVALRGMGLRRTTRTLQVAQTRMVDLGLNDEALIASFEKDTRYAIRRAEREGVEVRCIADPTDRRAIDALHELVRETQRRAGFALPSVERYRVAWRALGGAGRARILEAWLGDRLLASGMLVVEGRRSFYLFAGSLREAPGEPKRYASYALQWAMMRTAREMGSREHDLWGIAPLTAGRGHPWYGVGLFKKGFGGRAVQWAGSWDLVVDPTLYRVRAAGELLRGWVGRIRR